MNLFSFTAHFGTEDDCRQHFKSERDKIGVICKCGSTEHYWIKSRLSYECKKCIFKAKILNRHHREEINETIKESSDNQSIVFTDKILGNYHKIKRKYLQLYLNEFITS